MPPGLGPGQFRRHTDHGRSTQGRQPELAYASPGPPADMAVRRKREKGEIKEKTGQSARRENLSWTIWKEWERATNKDTEEAPKPYLTHSI